MLTPSTTTVDLNVGYPNIATVVHAVQGDNQSRILTANLYDGGIAWTPPTGAVGVIKFHTPLGTSGMYDTDEEGNTAVTWTGNVATLRIVQNALAVAGDVPMQLSFYDNQGAVITSFLWETLVQPSVLTDTQFMQTDYYNILSQQIAAILTAIADIPEPATSTPLMDGNAAVGTQNTFARGDHRHPTDTTRAPTNHASTGTSYGAGNASNYGHVKLSDSTSSTSGTSGGTAATPSAVKAAYDKANGKPDLSSTTPKMDGTAAVGTGTTAARADHVHPSDTSRVPTTRKVNNKALSADITLTAENIGYDDGLSEHTAGSTGAAIAALKGSINDVQGQISAYIETGNTSTRAYAVGDYLVWKGILYCVISTIASAGVNFTPNTNIQIAYIAEKIRSQQLSTSYSENNYVPENADYMLNAAIQGDIVVINFAFQCTQSIPLNYTWYKIGHINLPRTLNSNITIFAVPQGGSNVSNQVLILLSTVGDIYTGNFVDGSTHTTTIDRYRGQIIGLLS